MTKFDVGAEMIVGDRDHQEDCVAYTIDEQTGSVFIVLADGMGGHNAGEIASALTVKFMLNYFESEISKRKLSGSEARAHLQKALQHANDRMRRYQVKHPETKGMGTTLVALLATGSELNWISVGDSPLLVLENGELRRLNADHSYAAILDRKVAVGEMDSQIASVDPRRSQLTSAVVGRPIPQIDLNGLSIEPNSELLLIVASDGLLTCSTQQIQDLTASNRAASSEELAKLLVKEVVSEKMPDQDNTSIAVLRLNNPS